MKRLLKLILVITLLVGNLFVCNFPVSAGKAETKRNIAIVFDNSGSMYDKGEKAWCRATYAMEVFASMLNSGDTLSIHPMHPIEVNGKTYKMDSPFVISDVSQAPQIRKIYTPNAGGTPIETIDAAIKGLESSTADQNYMIVLTDGQAFYEGGKELSVSATKKKLAERFNSCAGPDLNVLYLGIGAKVAMPEMESEYYYGEKASDSKDVLSALTKLSNRIFARDTLPSSHISGKTIDFDISMSKLIVLVQGENVSNVKLTGKNGATATLAGSAKTHYSDIAAGNYKGSGESPIDKSLQGMLVTYTECSAGQYDISYSGKASNVEVYYEPDADLDFIFTDSEGNLVEPEGLYKGDYKVQFGLKDAKTGELITSDLIGDPVYEGKYIVNGQEFPIQHSGKSGETPVSLNMDDVFSAELTASYLSGYSITKTAKDFGWPDGSLKVAAMPAGKVRLEITGGDKVYDLKNLETSGPYIAKVFYQGVQLTGPELEKVSLKWEPEKSNAEIKKLFKDDHYELSLHYKNPNKPLDTKCGKCTVTIYAHYAAEGSEETKGQSPLTYIIEDKIVSPEISLSAPQKYFEISKIDKGKSLKAYITVKGNKLPAEEFKKLDFKVDCGGIGYKVTPIPEESAYEIKLNSTGVVEKGKYKIYTTVVQKDNLGREVTAEQSCKVKLSNIPLWLSWLIILLVIAAIIALIYSICHIKRLPTKLKTRTNVCEMTVGGMVIENGATFSAKIESGELRVESSYGGVRSGIRMAVQPGKDAYLMTKQEKRKALVTPSTVSKTGSATITEAVVANVNYVLDPTTNKLVPELERVQPFNIKHSNTISYSGTMMVDGASVPFETNIKLICVKK